MVVVSYHSNRKVTKTMTKSNLGRKFFFQFTIFRSHSITQDKQGRSSSQDPEIGAEAEAMEKHYLLAWSS